MHLVVLGTIVPLGWAPAAFAALPVSLDDFKAQHAELAKTPEGAAKCLFDAVYVYMNEETRDAGREMIQYVIIEFKDEPKWDSLPTSRIFVERMKDPAYHHIFRSYAKGTSPENGYAMDPNDYELNVERANPNHDKGFQLYLRSSGADIARPIYLKQSTTTQLWYILDHKNIYTGIRPPKDPNKEEFK
jgi:hypothetical protein